MIFWTLKLFKNLKEAIAGRRYPHQLAGAVAFGVLLGIVPHGNLLALAILILVLTLRVNHAMAGLTAVGISFLTTRFDTYTHEVGSYVLNKPEWQETLASAWELPLVPWTDLNNTVVMGSLVVGVAGLLPIFFLSYQFFKLFVPSEIEEQEEEIQQTEHANRNVAKHSVVLVDQAHQEVRSPQVHEIAARDHETTEEEDTATVLSSPGRSRFADHDDDGDAEVESQHVSVETRVDIIRMQDYREDASPVESKAQPQHRVDQAHAAQPEEPHMNEALNYLLRQLRDSQQRKAG